MRAFIFQRKAIDFLFNFEILVFIGFDANVLTIIEGGVVVLWCLLLIDMVYIGGGSLLQLLEFVVSLHMLLIHFSETMDLLMYIHLSLLPLTVREQGRPFK